MSNVEMLHFHIDSDSRNLLDKHSSHVNSAERNQDVFRFHFINFPVSAIEGGAKVKPGSTQ